MNILIITPWFPTEDDPVSGIFVLEQAQALQRKHRVLVMHPEPCLEGEKPEIKTGKIKGVEYLKCKFRVIPKLGIPFYILSVIKNYLRIKKYFVPDIIHSHVILFAGFGGIVLSKLFKIPVIVTEHSSNIDALCRIWIFRMLLIFVLKHSKIITVSTTLMKILRKYYQNLNVAIVPNIVNLEIFDFNHNYTVYNKIVFIGLLNSEIKGMDYLLKAFKKVVVDLNNDIYIDIVGGGKLKSQYEELTEKLGINENCRFLGKKDRHEVAEIIKNSDFLVLPSLFETFGIVLIEAMALGKPVIATKCGGPEEIVKDFNGILVDIGDIDSLSAAIMTMIKNLDTYEKEKIVGYVRDNYSAEGVADQLTEIYNNLVNSKNQD